MKLYWIQMKLYSNELCLIQYNFFHLVYNYMYIGLFIISNIVTNVDDIRSCKMCILNINIVLLNLQLPSNETNTSQRAVSGSVFCVFADCRWLSKKWMPQDRTEKGVSWGTGVITFWQLVADWSLQDRQLLKWNEEIKEEWKKSRESEEGREERSRDVRLHSVIFCIRRV